MPVWQRITRSRFATVSMFVGSVLTTHPGLAEDKASATSPKSVNVAADDWGDPNTMDRQAVIERTMRPFTGVSNRGVDTRTLTGKVMSGYQGWFNTPDDGAGRGWVHCRWSPRSR